MGYRRVRTMGGGLAGLEWFQTAIYGIAVDTSRRLYVVGDRHLAVFGADGVLVDRRPTERTGFCVAVDAKGAVYVGEEEQIEIFDLNGKAVRVWRDSKRLARVTAIGFHDEWVLIADAASRYIRRFDSNGRWVGDVAGEEGPRGFVIPNGHLDFAVDSEGVIHAPNSGKHRVERYTLEGKLLGQFGRWGAAIEDFSGCCNPTNLALHPDGRIVVSEKAEPRVKLYDREGQLTTHIPAVEFDPTCKNMDLAVDKDGLVYVVDTARRLILVFEAAAETPATVPPNGTPSDEQKKEVPRP